MIDGYHDKYIKKGGGAIALFILYFALLALTALTYILS